MKTGIVALCIFGFTYAIGYNDASPNEDPVFLGLLYGFGGTVVGVGIYAYVIEGIQKLKKVGVGEKVSNAVEGMKTVAEYEKLKRQAQGNRSTLRQPTMHHKVEPAVTSLGTLLLTQKQFVQMMSGSETLPLDNWTLGYVAGFAMQGVIIFGVPKGPDRVTAREAVFRVIFENNASQCAEKMQMMTTSKNPQYLEGVKKGVDEIMLWSKDTNYVPNGLLDRARA